MRYFTWKFDWAQEGTDPTYVVNSTGARFAPQVSSLPVEDVNALIYGYLLYGDFDLATVSTWNVIDYSNIDKNIAVRVYKDRWVHPAKCSWYC